MRQRVSSMAMYLRIDMEDLCQYVHQSLTDVHTHNYAASINTILEYLKETPHFKKFNRVAYAYRVDEMPVVFITEKKNVETQFY